MWINRQQKQKVDPEKKYIDIWEKYTTVKKIQIKTIWYLFRSTKIMPKMKEKE